RLPQLLRLEVRDQRIDHHIEVPVHDLGKIVHGQADAVVRHAVLGVVVRADLFGAVAAADHSFARGGELGLALLALDVVEARLQHLSAFARFLICDFSSWHETTTPVGRWVMRTAEYVVFTDWPPGPEEQNVSMRRSLSNTWMSMSSTSGRTATVIAEVWMRPWVSV